MQHPTTAVLNPAASAYTTVETKPQYLGARDDELHLEAEAQSGPGF